jgi:hypothetical protein
VNRVNSRRKRTVRYVAKGGPRRPSVWLQTVWPVTRTFVLGGLIVAILIPVANKAIKPFRLKGIEYRQTEKLRSDVHQLKSDNNVLQRKIRHLQTPEGRTQAARQYGLVKPGEITLIMGERDIAMANREDLPASSAPKSRHP